MSTLEQNKGIVQRIFKEFWLDGRTSVLDQLLATDVINHELSKEPLARSPYHCLTASCAVSRRNVIQTDTSPISGWFLRKIGCG